MQLACASLVPPSLPQNLLPCPSCCRPQQGVALSCAVPGCFAPNCCTSKRQSMKRPPSNQAICNLCSSFKAPFSFCSGRGGKGEVFKAQSPF